ncbi:hypothetical protein B0O99DRAFT_592516 [Bisporella sp. PMI_857]|nr:hypothetical protein B0O99DRAFT_592516 [Bisporella sp. PMI_857]
MLAMCCRMLAKNKMHPDYKDHNSPAYPPKERMVEALEAAKKLFAQPQVPISGWKYDAKAPKKHSYLPCRRLVVDLAIRVGQLQTTADVIAGGLNSDRFMSGAALEDYLNVPGIYDVLPLLAKKGKAGNPFYIEKNDAETVASEITKTVKLRVQEGRQWSLAPEKVGWKELLDRLAKGAWVVNEKHYRANNVISAEGILFPPATEREIEVVEKELAGSLRILKRCSKFQMGEIIPLSSMEWNEDAEVNVVKMDPASECDGYEHCIIPLAVWKLGQSGVVGIPYGTGLRIA